MPRWHVDALGCLGTYNAVWLSAMFRSPRPFWHGSTLRRPESIQGGAWLSSLMPLPCHTPTQTRMGLWLACAKPRSSGAKQKSVLCCWCGAGGQICSHSEPWRLCRYKLCVESAGIAAWLQINYLERTSPQQRPDSICTCGPRERLMPIPLVEAYQHHLRLYTGKTIHSADSESWCLLLFAAV